MLLLVLAWVFSAQAAEPVILQISPLVGDTVDRAERDQYRLFPGIQGFVSATFFTTPGVGFSVSLFDSVHGTRLRGLTPLQGNTIVLAIEHPELDRDPQALARFWESLESGEPQSASGQADQIRLSERQIIWTGRGVWLGSLAGSATASQFAVSYYGPGEGCGPTQYTVNVPLLMGVSCGTAALAGCGGYRLGSFLGRGDSALVTPIRAGRGFRTGLTVVGGLVGVTAGLAVALAGATYYGKTGWSREMVNDPYGLTQLPTLIAATGMAVDLCYLGHEIGRAIDERRARTAAARTEEKQ